MNQKSRVMALCGMMCALAVVIMALGGLIPLATFCCPALAGLALLPIFAEGGRRMALGAYAAISLLSLLLCPDREAALLFVFLGYYPVLKWTLERIRNRGLKVLAKLAVFDVAAAAMLLTATFLLNMQYILAEYAEMPAALLIFYILLCNFTMLVYDRLLTIMLARYLRRTRRKK